MIHKKGKREKKREEKGREEEKRREEIRKGKEDHRYVNYVCMELVTFRMEKYRFFCTMVWICLVLV